MVYCPIWAGLIQWIDKSHGCDILILRIFVWNPRNLTSNCKEMQDKEFLETLVKYLVDKPEKVSATRAVDEMGVLLTLDVDPSDMGQIIGRSGNTARAIRTLLRVVGAKNNARVNLKINQPEGTERPAGRERRDDHLNEEHSSDVDDLKL